MEYKLYNLLHKNLSKNVLFKLILGRILGVLGIFVVLIPLPLSVPIGTALIVIALMLGISRANKVKYIIKLRKSIVFLMKNIFNGSIVKRKVIDIKKLYKKVYAN